MAEIGRKGGSTVLSVPGAMSERGRLGGLSVSADREHMSTIGKKGAAARHVAR